MLFTLSNTPTQNYPTVLLISQDTLQSLVVQDVQPTRPKVRKGNPPGSTNITSILFVNYKRRCHAQRRQMTLVIIIAKMIRSISQPRLTCRCPQTHPFISRDMLRYSCSKPKEKTVIQVIFTQSSVSMTTTPEYLPVSGFNVPSLHLSQSLRIHPFQASQKQTATIQAT